MPVGKGGTVPSARAPSAAQDAPGGRQQDQHDHQDRHDRRAAPAEPARGLRRLGALVEAPWGMVAFGPTLTGTWEGPLQARRGARGHAHAQPVRPGPVYGPERPTSSKDRMTRSGRPSCARGAQPTSRPPAGTSCFGERAGRPRPWVCYPSADARRGPPASRAPEYPPRHRRINSYRQRRVLDHPLPRLRTEAADSTDRAADHAAAGDRVAAALLRSPPLSRSPPVRPLQQRGRFHC